MSNKFNYSYKLSLSVNSKGTLKPDFLITLKNCDLDNNYNVIGDLCIYLSDTEQKNQQILDELLTKSDKDYRDLKIYRDITPAARQLLDDILKEKENSGKVIDLGKLNRPFSIEDFVKFLDDKGIKHSDRWDEFDFNDEFFFLNVGVEKSRR